MPNLHNYLISLINTFDTAHIVFDREGNLKSISENFRQVFQIDPVIIKTEGFGQLLYPKDREKFKRYFEKVLNREVDSDELVVRLLMKDRSFRKISIRIIDGTDDECVSGVIVFVRDITKKLNSKLFKDGFFNLSLDLFAILDYTGKIIELNEIWHEKFGYPREEFLKSGFSLILNRDERMAAETLYDWLKMTGAPLYEYEVECLTKGGETRYVSWSARIDPQIGLVFLVGRDFTDKKLTEKKLIESEAKLTAIIENTKDIIFSIDRDYRLMKFNAAFSDIIKSTYGFSPKVGYSVVDPKAKESTVLRWKALYDRALAGEEVEAFIEADPPNEMNHYEVSINPIREESGDVMALAVFMRNVTDRINAEEEQRKIANLLTEKNRDLLNFSFIATHNLRAPVSNLISLLSLYDKENTSNLENVEIIQNFESSVRQLNETLQDLMQAVKIRDELNKKYEIVSLQEILDSVKTRLESFIDGKEVEISSDFSEISQFCYSKADLDSIFYNLISNSIRFSENSRKCIIKIKSLQNGDDIILVFSDNGKGIDLERYGGRLFGLYQRFHSENAGKGLGLYLLNTQIKSSGGKIEVASQPGSGTEFKITIRRRKEE